MQIHAPCIRCKAVPTHELLMTRIYPSKVKHLKLSCRLQLPASCKRELPQGCLHHECVSVPANRSSPAEPHVQVPVEITCGSNALQADATHCQRATAAGDRQAMQTLQKHYKEDKL